MRLVRSPAAAPNLRRAEPPPMSATIEGGRYGLGPSGGTYETPAPGMPLHPFGSYMTPHTLFRNP
jgi:hypothetical protein